MSYAFAPNEPIARAVPRIMNDRLDRIEEHLRARDVHEARKRIKEIRALLRLARGPLGPLFEPENFWYRDAGRELGPARDAEAALEVIGKLVAATWDREIRARLERARQILEGRLASVDVQPRIDALLAALPAARARVAQWPPVTRVDPERSVRAARRAYGAAREVPVAPRFHELRKRVKDCWYQRKLLQAKTKEIHHLSDVLGDDHDLHMLEVVLGDPALRDVIVARRIHLEQESLRLARRTLRQGSPARA